MKLKSLFLLLILAMMLLFAGCERKTTETIIQTIPGGSATYLGSKACEACHTDDGKYPNFMRTGHPYKLNDIDSAMRPVGQYYPFTTVPLPSDLNASDLSMVIGGFWWKARYINNLGEILTGADRQYNFATDEFVAYDAANAPSIDYDCGECHTTGYEPDGNHQNGLPGLVGTWELNGIQCEECHGPGSLHASDPYNTPDMIVDYDSEQCGKCHVRGELGTIPASGGFIMHHEQYNEVYVTKHSTLQRGCVHCHDVHYTLHPQASIPERDAAIVVDCESCHPDEEVSFANTDVDDHLTDPAGPSECIDCHMPFAVKSAVSPSNFVGDVRSHLFRINADSLAEMFSPDGSMANGYLTLEFTCLRCHDDESKAWAARHADDIHIAP
ncbi:MAG: multiheme c-type cytochrome [candidate division Zixibacteria bacterium]